MNRRKTPRCEPVETLRVMTYNVHSCIGMDGKLSPRAHRRAHRALPTGHCRVAGTGCRAHAHRWQRSAHLTARPRMPLRHAARHDAVVMTDDFEAEHAGQIDFLLVFVAGDEMNWVPPWLVPDWLPMLAGRSSPHGAPASLGPHWVGGAAQARHAYSTGEDQRTGVDPVTQHSNRRID